jgi:hypothetical protein
MSATFSINVGQIIESSKKSDIFSVLLDLPDNTKKLISPKDVRDAFFTAWVSSPIKLTTPDISGNVTYIGIDSSNPENRDIKKPIYIGKRQFGNLDIMNSTLLNTNNADIFFYNTKSDDQSQNSTKISILTGTDSNLHYSAPYIESLSGTNSISLNLVNPSPYGGGLNLVSTNGRVAINGVVFPTLAETSASASNGKILRYYGQYPNGLLRWDDSTVSLSSIGSPDSQTNIWGNTVSVNGFPIEFISNDLVPIKIGGIESGSSFSAGSFNNAVTLTQSNWPISEVLRNVLYPYVPPQLELSIINPTTGTKYAEVGTTTSFILSTTVSIFPRNPSEWVSDWTLTGTTYSHLTRTSGPFTITGLPGTQLSFTASGTTYSTGGVDFVFALSNSGFTASGYPFGFSYSATASVQFISPMYSKFDSALSLDNTTLTTIITSTLSTKFIGPKPDISLKLNTTGSGYLYFIYPYSYGDLTMIKDPNGFIIHDVTNPIYSGFTHSGVISGPSPYGNYKMYRTLLSSSYNGNGEFEFIF